MHKILRSHKMFANRTLFSSHVFKKIKASFTLSIKCDPILIFLLICDRLDVFYDGANRKKTHVFGYFEIGFRPYLCGYKSDMQCDCHENR